MRSPQAVWVYFFGALASACLFVILPSREIHASTRPTIVVMSMEDNHDELLWSEGEDRIAEELRVSDFSVVTVSAVSDVVTDFKDELTEVTQRHDAAAALTVYKSDEKSATLLLYVRNDADSIPLYKKCKLSLSSTQEEVDVAALKAADAVQASVIGKNVEKNAYTENVVDNASLNRNRKRSRTKPEVKQLIIFSLTGAAALAAGGVLNSRYFAHKNDALNFAEEAALYNESGLFSSADGANDRALAAQGKANAYLLGTCISYALGGTLVLVGVSLYLSKRKEKIPDQRSISFLPGATGFAMEF